MRQQSNKWGAMPGKWIWLRLSRWMTWWTRFPFGRWCRRWHQKTPPWRRYRHRTQRLILYSQPLACWRPCCCRWSSRIVRWARLVSKARELALGVVLLRKCQSAWLFLWLMRFSWERHHRYSICLWVLALFDMRHCSWCCFSWSFGGSCGVECF